MGLLKLDPVQNDGVEAWQFNFIRGVGWAEDQGRRAEMEDGMIIIKGWGGQDGSWLFGVYDGHGGRQTVDFLLKHLHLYLWKGIILRAQRRREFLMASGNWLFEAAITNGIPAPLALCSEEDVAYAMTAAFRATDEYILRSGVRESGSTACVCLVQPRLELPKSGNAAAGSERCPAVGLGLHTAHLGDSRVLLVYADGTCRRLTDESDHKASAPREVDRVERLGGFVVGERVNGMLAIGRAFGDWSLKLGPLCASQGTPRNLQSEYVVSNIPDISSVSFIRGPSGGHSHEGASSEGGPFVPAQCVLEATQGREPALIVMGCDGIFDVCSDEAVGIFALGIVETVARLRPSATASEVAETAARALVHEAVGLRHSTDNVSVIVCLLKSLEELGARQQQQEEEETLEEIRAGTPPPQLSRAPNACGRRAPLTARTANFAPVVHAAGDGKVDELMSSIRCESSRERCYEQPEQPTSTGGSSNLCDFSFRGPPTLTATEFLRPTEEYTQESGWQAGSDEDPEKQHASNMQSLFQELHQFRSVARQPPVLDEVALLQSLYEHQQAIICKCAMQTPLQQQSYATPRNRHELQQRKSGVGGAAPVYVQQGSVIRHVGAKSRMPFLPQV